MTTELEKVQLRIKQLKAKEANIKTRERGRKRKRRTHALVLLGAAGRKMTKLDPATKETLVALVDEKDRDVVRELLSGKLD